jgi:Ca2+-binding RTX toxin-like protein
VVEAANQGSSDTIMLIGPTNYVMTDNVENLHVMTASAANVTGNGSANVLVGGNLNDTLDGDAGNDTLLAAAQGPISCTVRQATTA